MAYRNTDDGIFDRLGSFVSRHWLLVPLVWLILIVLVYRVAPRWDDVTRDGDFAYLPAHMSSVEGEKLLQAAFPAVISRSQVILVIARRDGPMQPPDYDVADSLVERYVRAADAGGTIVDILSYQTPVVGEKLKSPPGPDGQAVLVVIRLGNEFMARGNMDFVREVQQTLESVRRGPGFPAGLQLGVTGSATVGSDMFVAVDESLRNTEFTTIALVIAILLVVYRAPGLLIVPVATIFASLVVALGIVALATQCSQEWGWLDYKVFKTTRIFVVVVLFGAGTDFCLFLISRYREELNRGFDPAQAIAIALGRVGGALTASAMTTILGLGMMACCEFGKFRNSGPSMALCLAVALVASLTLTPALLRIGGWAVFWPWHRRSTVRVQTPGADTTAHDLDVPDSAPTFSAFWQWLARHILARPGWILLGSLVALAPLAYQGLFVEVTYDLLSELGSDCPSVQGTNLLRRYFPAGQVSPITLLAHRAEGGLEDSSALRERIRQLTYDLTALTWQEPNGQMVQPITSIRSMLEPLGDQAAKTSVRGSILKGIVRGRTKNTFLAQTSEYAGKVVRFDLVSRYDPFSHESIRLLDRIEEHLRQVAEDPQSDWRGTKFCFAGTTAQIRDLKEVTASDLRLAQELVPLVVLGVLIIIIRRPLVSIYLIFSVLFGYFVSIGFTKLAFAWMHGEEFLGLDWKVPMFLFVLLIAVGEDYNIYLITRVMEEQKRRGAQEGLRVALVRTGGIITSCGVIMAGTFASMLTGSLSAIQQLGVALSFGVLLDTLVIRTVLVPAFLSVWDRWTEALQSRFHARRTGGPP